MLYVAGDRPASEIGSTNKTMERGGGEKKRGGGGDRLAQPLQNTPTNDCGKDSGGRGAFPC